MATQILFYGKQINYKFLRAGYLSSLASRDLAENEATIKFDKC